MTEPDTREVPGAFDAFATLRPGEKHFTLQGGDPIVPGLVLLWAKHARKRAMALPEDSAERQELLLRATSAEEIAWDMQAYQKDQKPESDQAAAYAQSVTEAVDKSSDDALDKLLKHRMRVEASRKLDDMVAVLHVMEPALREIGALPEDLSLTVNAANLKVLSAVIRPHR